MRRKLLSLPQVSRDIAEAGKYYESLSPGSGGSRFKAAVKQAQAEIESGFRTHMRVFGNFHRVFVPKFPYNLYYRLQGQTVVIIAVLYARFDPERIAETLAKRA